MGKSALIVVIGFSVIMGRMLLGINDRTVSLSESVTQHYNGLIARNVASSGANIALSKLARDPAWRGGIPSTAFAGGYLSVTVADTAGEIAITSHGSTADTVSTVIVNLIQAPGIWSFSLFAGEKKIDLYDKDGGTGVINGDIYSNGSIDINYSDYTVNGTVTGNSAFIDPPVMDWTVFEDEAIASGQYVSGDKDFTLSGSPYTGVWYVTGKAKIKHNGVTVNGTIVAEKRIEIYKNDFTITAPPNYPALISGEKVIVKKDRANITGLVYCTHFHPEGDDMILTGAVIALHTIHRAKGQNMTITFDESAVTDLVGTSFNPAISSELKILGWQW